MNHQRKSGFYDRVPKRIKRIRLEVVTVIKRLFDIIKFWCFDRERVLMLKAPNCSVAIPLRCSVLAIFILPRVGSLGSRLTIERMLDDLLLTRR